MFILQLVGVILILMIFLRVNQIAGTLDNQGNNIRLQQTGTVLPWSGTIKANRQGFPFLQYNNMSPAPPVALTVLPPVTPLANFSMKRLSRGIQLTLDGQVGFKDASLNYQYVVQSSNPFVFDVYCKVPTIVLELSPSSKYSDLAYTNKPMTGHYELSASPAWNFKFATVQFFRKDGHSGPFDLSKTTVLSVESTVSLAETSGVTYSSSPSLPGDVLKQLTRQQVLAILVTPAFQNLAFPQVAL